MRNAVSGRCLGSGVTQTIRQCWPIPALSGRLPPNQPVPTHQAAPSFTMLAATSKRWGVVSSPHGSTAPHGAPNRLPGTDVSQSGSGRSAGHGPDRAEPVNEVGDDLDRVFVDSNELFQFSVMDLLLSLAKHRLLDFVWTDALLDGSV